MSDASMGYEKRLAAAIGDTWVGATPGLRLQVHERGKLQADLALGKTYPVYDWASLTKIVFSVTAVMRAVEERRVALAEPAVSRLPFFADSPAREANIARLLSHSAGLAWWEPFYEKLDRKLPRAERWEQMRGLLGEAVQRSPPEPQGAVYSDLDFFCLGYILEDAYHLPLLEVWNQLQSKLELPGVEFHVDNKPSRPRTDYAPTEAGGFRAKLPKSEIKLGEGGAVQGEVHDENAWALGGVAPHAGLFGGIDALSRYGLLLRKALSGDRASSSFPKPETVQRFARRATTRDFGDWASGFMMPSRENSSAGRLFGPRSIGHTGFTGTSIWLDPGRDLLVTILSNRVHPTRENKKFVELRGQLHNKCVECL